MTFDEALEVLANSENNKLVKEGQLEYGLYRAFDVVGVLQNLKQEYAPTVEMTKEQYKIFNEDIQLNQKALNDYIDEGMGLPKITNKEMLNLYIHPETIKIIDEEQL